MGLSIPNSGLAEDQSGLSVGSAQLHKGEGLANILPPTPPPGGGNWEDIATNWEDITINWENLG